MSDDRLSILRTMARLIFVFFVFLAAAVGTGFGVSAAMAEPAPTSTAGASSTVPAMQPRAESHPEDRRRPGSHQIDAAAQRRRELDDLRREDVASQLMLLGVPLKWQEHTLAELVDWRDRIEAAVTLRVQARVDADWRVTSLSDLIDMRLRAAKASELSSLYGLRVDWRRYSWIALEDLRRRMAKQQAHSSADFPADGLVTPGSAGSPRRHGLGPMDPDAIIEPTFAFDTPMIWSRPFGRHRKPDPDAILVPTFVTVPTPPIGRDDLIDPWSTQRRFSDEP
jgi:hypothetical protein